MNRNFALAMPLASILIACGATGAAHAAEQGEGNDIVVTGTRRLDRTATQLATPVDVLSAEDLNRQGTPDVQQMLKTLVPSYDVRYYPTSDGSAFVRPATLRNMNPSEVLVLVNGKRLHRSALLQTGGGILASGAQGADIGQIPAIALQSVEVLRDGASALYGSDAIAGVINFRLRERSEGVTMTAQYGQFYPGDGATMRFAANAGFRLGADGFLTLSGEWSDADATSRGAQNPSALALATSDPALSVRNPAQIWGQPNARGYKFYVNAGVDLSDAVRLYGNAGVSSSKNNTSFNYRLSRTVTGPNATGTGTQTFTRNSIFNPIYTSLNAKGEGVITGSTFNFSSIFPAGFTPQFHGDLLDVRGTLGLKGEAAGGWSYDVSGSFGESRVKYAIENTVNPSLGAQSPTAFKIGTLKERDIVLNADISKALPGIGDGFTLTAGLEYRRENYQIGAGEPASYQAGRYARVPLINADGSPALGADGKQIIAVQAVGSNGFPGFTPADEVDRARKSYAAYVNLEGDLTDRLSGGIAGRYEHFSDFGSSFTGKASARFELTKGVALRGGFSTGFRAPAPAQLYSRSTSVQFVVGQSDPLEILLLPATDPIARAGGAVPLKPEKSRSYMAGLVLDGIPGVVASIDYYRTHLKNQITYSEYFFSSSAPGGAYFQYFTNALSARYQGVEAVVSYRHDAGDIGKFNTTLSASYNRTKVTDFDPGITSSLGIQGLETQNPHFRAVVAENWEKGPFSLVGRVNYFGPHNDFDTGSAVRYGGRASVDLEVAYKLLDNFTIAAGAENLFDTYPGKIPGRYISTGGLSNGQIYPLNGSPGYNGGFWYVRLKAEL